MNTYVALSCLLAFATVCHGSAIGWSGVPLGVSLGLAPAAVSTANLVKAAPIPVIRTAAVAPIISPVLSHAPIIRTVALASPISTHIGGPIVSPIATSIAAPIGLGLGGLGGWGGLGLKGVGLGWGH